MINIIFVNSCLISYLVYYHFTDINIIFAITEEAKPIYQKLAEFVGQDQNVGVLSDQKALEKMIEENYDAILSKHELFA